jgi:tetratricopeptide (TPR) repeat protein
MHHPQHATRTLTSDRRNSRAIPWASKCLICVVQCALICLTLPPSMTLAEEPPDYCHRANRIPREKFQNWRKHRDLVHIISHRMLEEEGLAWADEDLPKALEYSSRVRGYIEEHLKDDPKMLVFVRSRDINQQRVAEMPEEKQQLYFQAKAKERDSILHMHKGEMDVGVRLVEELLELHKVLFGEEDLARSIFLAHYGAQLAAMGDNSKAAEVFSDAVRVQRKHLGKEHPVHLLAYSKLAQINGELGQHAEAEDMLRSALAILSENSGEYCGYYIATLWRLARVLNQQERFDEAHILARRAVSRSGFLSKVDDSLRIRCLAELGRTQLALGDYAAAENVFAGTTPWLASPDCWLPYPLISEYLADHVQVLQKLGRMDEADQVEAKRRKLKVRMVTM